MKLLQTIDLYRNAADNELFKAIHKEYREKTNDHYKGLEKIEDNREWMLKKTELAEALRKTGYYMDWYGKDNEKIEN